MPRSSPRTRRSILQSQESAVTDSEPGQGWTNGSIHPQLYPNTRSGRLEIYGGHRRWIGLASGWTRIGEGAANDARHSGSKAAGESLVEDDPEEEARAVRGLIAQLCESFYRAGWATGTGGGVSIRVGGPSQNRPWRVFVAPSGIQKEDMIGRDIFELDMDRNVVVAPETPGLRQSACTPLWYVVYRNRPKAAAVIHTHSMNAVLATLLDPTEQSKVLKITHLEMLKGVGNHAYDDTLEIPIIDNRPTEDQLADQLESVIKEYPNCNAVLVRRHGVYVWGDSWEQAKTQCESFDYLFETAVRMKQATGINPATVPSSGSYRIENEINVAQKKRKAEDGPERDEPSGKKLKSTEAGFRGEAAASNKDDLVSNEVPILPRDARILLLDIEGCCTSISFVKDVLFPYVLEHIEDYLAKHVLPKEEVHKELCVNLAKEVQQAAAGSDGGTPGDSDALPSDGDAAAMVRWLVRRDVKAAALKTLQGQMWKVGYDAGELKGHVYSDFEPTLRWMQKHSVKIYIYSSGSVKAQKLLFGHSIVGDLLPYVSGHFDIPTAGNKKEAASYTKIAKQLGVDPGCIVFCSDSEAELAAAKEAGIRWPVMTIRPGNAPLTDKGKEEFPAVYSLLQLCGE